MRPNEANITGLGTMSSDASLTLEKLFLKRAEQDFRVERHPC